MSDTSSSEDSDFARFAAVAVTGNQIAEGAVKSAQVNLTISMVIPALKNPPLCGSNDIFLFSTARNIFTD